MADPSSSNNSSLPSNIVNGALALLTLIGGLYYFKTKTLTSDRPVALPGESRDFPGEQQVEARLWEDPFKDVNPIRENGNQTSRNVADATPPALPNPQEEGRRLNELIASIANNSSSDSRVLILPVMVQDGQYSEDRESRIRSRFAVVAGLGVRGFVPQDAEHIGYARIAWPSEGDLEKVTQLYSTSSIAPHTLSANLFEELSKTNYQPVWLHLRYEWFRPRDFYQRPANYEVRTNVLVLWLSEGFFDDVPLVRLPLLLYSLRQTNKEDYSEVKLIGPALSSTLQKMLPGQFPGDKDSVAEEKLSGRPEVTNLLKHIEMFCATPSAMDEALVSNATELYPRAAVGADLTNAGLKSFHNFTVTDAQLAEEACDELALRNADLSDSKNHLVLIGEWDTFYARMASLTYQAELAVLQEKRGPPALQEYIDDYRHERRSRPPNFHPYYYLRGLDGQTVLANPQSSGKTDRAESDRPRPASVEEFRQWEPDSNKAEGPSQLDYLARLGDLLQQLDDNLRRTNGGQIKAIGILGSDVYDTLIILQALRDRFPNALFFTTGLDARLWHPRELKWSRNLLVFSGYGLALETNFQHGNAPFRDSDQTAQYAATLAALDDTNLVDLARVPPRRFEIGRHGAVDLSMSNSEVVSDDLVSNDHPGFRLHPATFRERYKTGPYMSSGVLCSAGILVILVFALVLFCKPIARLTWQWSRFLSDSLEYTTEDFGGPDGAAVLLRQLDRNPDPFFGWIRAELDAEFERTCDGEWRQRLKDAEAEKPASREQVLQLEEMHEKLAYAMAATFNRILKHNTIVPPYAYYIQNKDVVPDHIHNKAQFLSLSLEWETTKLWGKLSEYRKRLLICEAGRACLDDLLENMHKADGVGDQLSTPGEAAASPGKRPEHKASSREPKDGVLKAAAAARQAARDIFELLRARRTRLGLVLFATAVLATGLGGTIWWDTFYNLRGQGLSFENGASAWPAQIVRSIAGVVAVWSCITIYFKRRIAFARITREFRFACGPPAGGVPAGRICAMESWLDYTNKRSGGKRFFDIYLPLVLYFLFCLLIFVLAGGTMPYSPIRGDLVSICNKGLLFVVVVLFFILTFVTIDTALRCRQFILRLGDAPTDYPETTRRHFARINGSLDEAYLDEWIDIQLIGELTEHIGGMVYYPFLVFGFPSSRSLSPSNTCQP
jgi:hypothetical protein